MKLRFSSDLIVDTECEPWRHEGLRIAMLGGPGSGKSWNNSLIAEQFLQQGGTVVIFQPRDEYFTLKERFDVLSVGGVHAKDIEFALTAPSLYAKAVIEDGISMIFYTSGIEDEQKLIEWVSRFISLVLKYEEQHKRPLLLILEEAQEYAPRSPSGHVAPPWVYNRMVKAFKDCFTQGRKLGIVAVASSQRPQELNFTIRQLANLTFYGKFSDQDIGYIDKECLKYLQKRGIDIEASRLVELGLGEWLVIMGKNSRFLKVTEQRVTKHGAETPRLEYIAPRPIETKKSVEELGKSILAALQKEEEEKSEIAKLQVRNRDLQKKLAEAEEKGRIKETVQEMFSSAKGQPRPAEIAEAVEHRFKGQQKHIEELENNLTKTEKEKALLQEELEEYSDLKKALEKIMSKPQPVAIAGAQMNIKASITEISVENVSLKEIELTTKNSSGKLMFCAVKLHARNQVNFSSADLQKEAAEYAWPIPNVTVGKTLGTILREGWLIKEGDVYRLPSQVIVHVRDEQ